MVDDIDLKNKELPRYLDPFYIEYLGIDYLGTDDPISKTRACDDD